MLKKWSGKNILICPVCGNPYEYCHGMVATPYFRHKEKAECPDKYTEPETKEHIKGKQDLYYWISNQDDVSDVILEGWLPETKQRPDIMFKHNKIQYVIEYQCTPIASEFYERHLLYQAAGIHDIWICGTEKYFFDRARDKTIENHCDCYYNSSLKLFAFNNINYHHPILDLNAKYNSNDNVLLNRVKSQGVGIREEKVSRLPFYYIAPENTIFDNDKICLHQEFLINVNHKLEIKKTIIDMRKDYNGEMKLGLERFCEKCVKLIHAKYQNFSNFHISCKNYKYRYKIEIDSYVFTFQKKTNIIDFYDLIQEKYEQYNYTGENIYEVVNLICNFINPLIQELSLYDSFVKEYKDYPFYLIIAESKRTDQYKNVRFKYLSGFLDSYYYFSTDFMKDFLSVLKFKSSPKIFMIPFSVYMDQKMLLDIFKKHGFTNVKFFSKEDE